MRRRTSFPGRPTDEGYALVATVLEALAVAALAAAIGIAYRVAFRFSADSAGLLSLAAERHREAYFSALSIPAGR